MIKAMTILAAAGFFAVLCPAASPSSPSPVTVRAGHVSISAAGRPLADVLLPLCRAADCEWAPEAGLTNTVTLSVEGLDPRDALVRVLAPFDYVILWRPDRPSLLRILGPASTEQPASDVPSPAAAPSPAIAGTVAVLRAAYAAETDPDRRNALEADLCAVVDPSAEPDLVELASQPAGAPLRAEAMTALANMGSATAADFLLARVEAGGPDADPAAALVSNIALSPRTAAALRVAALGNKRFSSPPARLAALQGLAHLRDGGTRAVLETLSQDPDEIIRLAAREMLNQETGGL